jgi:hypothetical protein
MGSIILKLVWLLLPGSVAFDANPHTAKDHFFSSSEIDTELHNIAVFDRIQTRDHTWLTETHMVQKCPRRAPNVFDVPLSIDEHELAVFSTDYL